MGRTWSVAASFPILALTPRLGTNQRKPRMSLNQGQNALADCLSASSSPGRQPPASAHPNPSSLLGVRLPTPTCLRVSARGKRRRLTALLGVDNLCLFFFGWSLCISTLPTPARSRSSLTSNLDDGMSPAGRRWPSTHHALAASPGFLGF